MPMLPDSVHAWNTETFSATLKREIESLGKGALPLQRCVAQGGVADEETLSIMILDSSADAYVIRVRIGVLFNEIVAGCNCADEPMAVNAYGELHLSLDRASAEVNFAVITQ